MYPQRGVIVMPKDISISIRMDSELKRQSEHILAEFGLNMTAVVNMLFHQIVRDKAIPLSLSLTPQAKVNDELLFAQLERRSGFVGRTAEEVADEMEKTIEELEGEKKQV
jgi:DNA-damage-inducible protein J